MKKPRKIKYTFQPYVNEVATGKRLTLDQTKAFIAGAEKEEWIVVNICDLK